MSLLEMINMMMLFERGVVCAYVKKSLTPRYLSNPSLKECLILKVCINNRKGYVLSFYRSSSYTADEFDSDIIDLEKLVVDMSCRKSHITPDWWFQCKIHELVC